MEKSRLIGIVGAGRGTGTTHLSILTANYLASCRQRNTALIQWSGRMDLWPVEHMLKGCRKRKEDTDLEEGFRLLEVDYYHRGDAGVLTRCMGLGYEDIVIDFGEMRQQIRTEWLRCGINVVTASLSEWKLEAFLELLSGEEKRQKGWIYTAAFGSEDTRREIERRFRIPLRRIPLSVDAFSVDRKTMEWFEKILQ